MAKAVKEIMNPELFSVAPDDDSEQVVQEILALGVSGAPVVDAGGHAIGFVSLRDLLASHAPSRVFERMSKPPVTIRESADIEDAALLAVSTKFHHLPVVDERGIVTGLASALDLLAGLVGFPAQHPATFPHIDRLTGLAWSEYRPLACQHLSFAPDGPGVFVLVHGERNRSETVVWAEAANNVRTRLYELLSAPQSDSYLNRLLSRVQSLRFRATAVEDPAARDRALAAVRPHPLQPAPSHWD